MGEKLGTHVRGLETRSMRVGSVAPVFAHAFHLSCSLGGDLGVVDYEGAVTLLASGDELGESLEEPRRSFFATLVDTLFDGLADGHFDLSLDLLADRFEALWNRDTKHLPTAQTEPLGEEDGSCRLRERASIGYEEARARGVECRELSTRVEGLDADTVGLEHFERARNVEDRLGARAEDGDGGAAQLGQVSGHVHCWYGFAPQSGAASNADT